MKAIYALAAVLLLLYPTKGNTQLVELAPRLVMPESALFPGSPELSYARTDSAISIEPLIRPAIKTCFSGYDTVTPAAIARTYHLDEGVASRLLSGIRSGTIRSAVTDSVRRVYYSVDSFGGIQHVMLFQGDAMCPELFSLRYDRKGVLKELHAPQQRHYVFTFSPKGNQYRLQVDWLQVFSEGSTTRRSTGRPAPPPKPLIGRGRMLFNIDGRLQKIKMVVNSSLDSGSAIAH
jgi:hypothetical protein